MNSSRRSWVSALAGFGAAAVALGAGLALGPVGSARAAPAPEFTLEFLELEPGVPQTDVGTFALDRAADLVAFEWLELVGVLAPAATTIDIEVCDSAGSCVDPRTIAGPVPFASGTGSVTVTVELVGAVGSGETGSLVGRLSFAAADEGLAATGSDVESWLAAGIAAIALGTLVFVLVRRRGTPRDEWPG